MTTRTFGRLILAVVAVFVGYGVFLLVTQWQTYRIGDYVVRRNNLTGLVQVEAGGAWKQPFDNDPYAVPLTTDDLKRVQLENIVWGPRGLLCARAVVKSGNVQGRLAIHVVIQDIREGKIAKDRALRETVNWPAGTSTPFVLSTGLDTPGTGLDTPGDTKRFLTRVTLQPTLVSGEGAGGTRSEDKKE